MPEEDPELLAVDLLPPDEEPPTATEPKRIAERRVTGWTTSARLFERRRIRPAGNSRGFWARIEDDDPFLPRASGKRVAQTHGHDVYAADRLSRIEPDGRVIPAKQGSPPPRPQPRREARRERTPPPPPPRHPSEPVHTPEKRPAPSPRQRARAPDPEPLPPQEPTPAPPPIDRRPPRLPNPSVRTKSGRMRAAPRRKSEVAAYAAEAPPRPQTTAEEIRRMKAEDRKKKREPPPTPKLRGLDNIIGLMGQLQQAQEAFSHNVKQKQTAKRRGTEAGDLVAVPDIDTGPSPAEQARRDERQRERAESQRRARRAPPPAPKPTRAPPPPAAREARPPQQQSAPPATKKRSPDRGRSGAGLDDLFGGGPQEGRVRIGKRSKKD
jgi:hypothetical protein